MPVSNFTFFLIVSFGISTPLFFISTRQTSPLIILLLFLVGSYAPAFGAWLALSRANDEEKQAFHRNFRGWGSRNWILFALLAPSVVWLAAFGLSSMSGEVEQPLWLYLAALPLIFLVNFGEEVGWRGYALPYLMKRFNPFLASLVLGAIWALFHAVLYWQRPLFGLLTSIVIMLLSLLLAWVFLNTKSILPGTLLHAVYNVWGYVFMTGSGGESMLPVVIALLGILTGRLVFRFGRTLSTRE